ncbi:MAG: sigma-70 family RNA polymerase sigma factor [Actinomycetota bacterium]
MTTSMVETFEAERDRLFGVAYRLLGSVSDTEDVLQEAYLRWADQAGRTIDNPAAFLTTVVSRLALDRLRSARHRREQYVGPWLPEPVEAAPGPDDDVVLAESLTLGFLAVMERLGPVERAVFVLHDVFAVPYAEIAAVVDRSESTCRQIARRARSRVQAEGPAAGARGRVVTGVGEVGGLGLGAGAAAGTTAGVGAEQEALLSAFLAAVLGGDVVGLERLLAADVVHLSDGGADHHAARRPVVGRDRVARFFVNLAKRSPEDAVPELVMLNGDPSILVTVDGAPRLTLTMAVEDGLITRVWAMVNPDKITHLRRS